MVRVEDGKKRGDGVGGGGAGGGVVSDCWKIWNPVCYQT